jgi:hypothetical protein
MPFCSRLELHPAFYGFSTTQLFFGAAAPNDGKFDVFQVCW